MTEGKPRRHFTVEQKVIATANFEHSLIDSLYDIESSLDEQETPDWAWEALSNLEDAIGTMQKRSLQPAPEDYRLITEALDAINNNEEITPQNAKRINNSLMGLRAQLNDREQVAALQGLKDSKPMQEPLRKEPQASTPKQPIRKLKISTPPKRGSDNLTPQPNDMCALAQSALDANQYDTALKLAMDVIKNAPHHDDINEVYLCVSRAFSGKKDYQRAYQAFVKAFRQLDGNHPNYSDLKSELIALKRKAKET